jgi:hypothetical protein
MPELMTATITGVDEAGVGDDKSALINARFSSDSKRGEILRSLDSRCIIASSSRSEKPVAEGGSNRSPEARRLLPGARNLRAYRRQLPADFSDFFDKNDFDERKSFVEVRAPGRARSAYAQIVACATLPRREASRESTGA